MQKSQCKICNFKHNTILHIDNVKNRSSVNAVTLNTPESSILDENISSAFTISIYAIGSSKKVILFKIMLVASTSAKLYYIVTHNLILLQENLQIL